ncbi:MAG: hypothetical protein M2R45_01436 [Verrucomicrobia subdivision 3 bacterium]|nr:hypothetical protein [Limisphaerales bacterium]MCS1417618.1 hypothetical protein [Limisphaerales bacterium]
MNSISGNSRIGSIEGIVELRLGADQPEFLSGLWAIMARKDLRRPGELKQSCFLQLR